MITDLNSHSLMMNQGCKQKLIFEQILNMDQHLHLDDDLLSNHSLFLLLELEYESMHHDLNYQL